MIVQWIIFVVSVLLGAFGVQYLLEWWRNR
jgi:hypothetical protein